MGARRVAWYKTDAGRIAIGVALAVVVGVVWWGVAAARSSSADLAARQAAVDNYTGRVRALVQGVRPAAEAMAQVPTGGPQGPALRDLGKASGDWVSILSKARAQAKSIFPIPVTATANSLFAQSVSMYLSTAKTYALVAGAPPALRSDLAARAQDQRDQSAQVWLLATRALDEARGASELSPSGIGLPSTVPPGGQQPAAPTPQATKSGTSSKGKG